MKQLVRTGAEFTLTGPNFARENPKVPMVLLANYTELAAIKEQSRGVPARSAGASTKV